MAKTGSNGYSIATREAFWSELHALVQSASDEGIPFEGSYELPIDDGVNVKVTASRVADPDDATDVAEEGLPTNRSSDSLDVTSRTSLLQVLTGMPLQWAGGSAVCSDCGRSLREGDPVTAHVVKPIPEFSWEVEQVYCEDCRPVALQSARVGRFDLLASATVSDVVDVSQQTTWKILSNVSIVDYSPPAEDA